MQHSALHSVENRNFTKSQNTSTATKQPPPATCHSAITDLDSTDPSSTTTSDVKSTPSSMETSNETLQPPLDPDAEVIETEYFDVPMPLPPANKAIITIPAVDPFRLLTPMILLLINSNTCPTTAD
jgi:hypothetical protein